MGSYDKGPHIGWWQGLPAAERFHLMLIHQVTSWSKKWIYLMWSKEVEDDK